MNILTKILSILMFPVCFLCQILFVVKSRDAKITGYQGGIPIIDYSDSIWGWVGFIAMGFSPAFTVMERRYFSIYSNIIILRKVPLGVIYHEAGHVLYRPAFPVMDQNEAHGERGCRMEHQADKYAIMRLAESGEVSEIKRYIDYLDHSLFGDGKYRAKLLRRFVRRYKIA